MEKKFKLTKESIIYCGRTLYHIEALKDFGNVKKGDKGGYVQSEDNLSQEGDCWISDKAKVFGNAQVYCDAVVFGNAEVFSNAQIFHKAIVADNALVCGNAIVFGSAVICDNAKVSGNAYVYGYARVSGNAIVYGNAIVSDNAKVYDDAKVSGYAKVYDNAEVFGYAQVSDNAEICSDAEIKNSSDYIVFKNWWSSGRYFTWTKSNNMWKVGCFYGTGEELIAKAYKDSELSGREYERIVGYVESMLRNTE